MVRRLLSFERTGVVVLLGAATMAAACDKTPLLAPTKSTITVSDFRFFVSGVSLVSASGETVPVSLTQDGKWQNGTVALLDFEDGTATCSNGTNASHNTTT